MPAKTPAQSGQPMAGAQASSAEVVNRAAFDGRLAQEWDRAQRAAEPLSLLLIDVDHFRAYADTHTATLSEERLNRIATTLARAVFRPADMVARYDDDEFAILLPAVHEMLGGPPCPGPRAPGPTPHPPPHFPHFPASPRVQPERQPA